MKKGDTVILNHKIGKLAFIDNPWNHKDGSPADILCRVQLDGEIDERTGFPANDHWCRLSELEKTDIKKEEKMETTNQQKPEVSIDSFYALDIRFCFIEEVEDILKNLKKPFDVTENPVKAYKLTIDTGFDKRTVVTNIVHIPREELYGTCTTFILNFPEASIRGFQSKGMIFMVDHNELVRFQPKGEHVTHGSEIGKVVI